MTWYSIRLVANDVEREYRVDMNDIWIAYFNNRADAELLYNRLVLASHVKQPAPKAAK